MILVFTSAIVSALAECQRELQRLFVEAKAIQLWSMYVTLSRVMSLRGLHLTGEFKAAAITSDPRAIQEYPRM